MRLPFRNDYPANRDTLHDAVRASVGNRCIRCGHPQGDSMRPESDDDFHYSGRADCGERRAIAKILMPCDDRCTHRRDGKLRILTVHHMDGDKANSAWWNLLALCQSCHLTIQAHVIPERPWMLPHSDWFRVYAAGFYARYYGGAEITREEAEARTDDYLAMGQPWLYEPTRVVLWTSPPCEEVSR